jgi:hypothetical protein
MSAAKVKELAAEIVKIGVDHESKEVMVALAIATASIMKASFTPEIHGEVLAAFVDNVRHSLEQMRTMPRH